jgi:hypothetical protein
VNEARMMNLPVLERNILSDYLTEQVELADIGRFLALTSNNELNIFACRKFRKEFEKDAAYRLITRNEMKFTSLVRPKDILFGSDVDFYKLVSLSRKYPTVHELEIDSKEQLEILMNDFPENSAPLFIKRKDDSIEPVLNERDIVYEEGMVLAYLGALISSEATEEEEEEIIT